ncbi:MAG: hypothetical protein H0W36_00110 [Gemmatimonadetes bacterium]|nr:hypothetical protein [Gemmatimonadota bacterium]
MSEPFYTSSVKVEKVAGVHRRATIPTGVRFDMGVHGPIREHYRIDAPDLPLPVDYIVAAAAG